MSIRQGAFLRDWRLMQTLRDRGRVYVSRQKAFIRVGRLIDHAFTVNILCFFDSLVKLTLEGGRFQ